MISLYSIELIKSGKWKGDVSFPDLISCLLTTGLAEADCNLIWKRSKENLIVTLEFLNLMKQESADLKKN